MACEGLRFYRRGREPGRAPGPAARRGPLAAYAVQPPSATTTEPVM